MGCRKSHESAEDDDADDAMNKTAMTVTQNVSQSVLIKMQELSGEYANYQSR